MSLNPFCQRCGDGLLIRKKLYIRSDGNHRSEFFLLQLVQIKVELESEGALYLQSFKSENSSVGRAQPCQGWGREFESRFSLLQSLSDIIWKAFFIL